MEESYKNSLINKIVIISVLLQTISLCLESFLFNGPINNFIFHKTSLVDENVKLLEIGIYIFSFVLLYLGITKKENRLLLISSLLFLADALFTTILGGRFGHEYVVGSHLARIALPAYLIVRAYFGTKTSLWLLKVSIASTFIFHGISALGLNPIFKDYLFEAFYIINIDLSNTYCEQILYSIGVLDILVGLLVVNPKLTLKSEKSLVIHLCVWGFVTAFFRIIYHQELGVLPFFLRCSHFTIPLIILLQQDLIKININKNKKIHWPWEKELYEV